jgi:hypothetical protein
VKIKIDLNNPNFQQTFFSLEKNEQAALLKTLKKISQLNWEQLYLDNGLKWEKITSKTSKSGNQIYSFRFSQKYRATALRQENFLRMLMLHTDHDSAYK